MGRGSEGFFFIIGPKIQRRLCMRFLCLPLPIFVRPSTEMLYNSVPSCGSKNPCICLACVALIVPFFTLPGSEDPYSITLIMQETVKTYLQIDLLLMYCRLFGLVDSVPVVEHLQKLHTISCVIDSSKSLAN
jgi:hypothetical protein